MALRRPRAIADDASEVQQARADVAAVTAVVQALSRATSVTTAVESALAVVRDRFGWAYGSYWRVDTSGREPVLRFAQESGAVGDEFRRVTLEASFARGTGLCGRAWAGEDVVFVPDLGEVTDCVRAPVAQRAGVRSATCLPVKVGDRVIGTMDFFTTDLLVMSPHRLDALRAELLAAHPDLPAMWIVGDDGTWRSPLHVATDWPGHFPRVAETVCASDDSNDSGSEP